jgi:catechol 2,3-dioxygenase-like lactoylglutathione lyase family enzyme
MFGKPPFHIPDNYAIDVRSLSTARAWYKEKLELREMETDREEDSGRPFADLSVSKNGGVLSIVELPSGATAEKSHVIFYTGNLEKAHRWMTERGVQVEPITTDSGGNRLFHFRDLDGNAIEVCVEP